MMSDSNTLENPPIKDKKKHKPKKERHTKIKDSKCIEHYPSSEPRSDVFPSNNSKKTLFKIVIRKLPVKDFTYSDFIESVDKVCEVGNLLRTAFVIEHFCVGKISRKRGPVFGYGFIGVKIEEQYIHFLNLCPNKIPFIEDEFNAQPEVGPAPFTRTFKVKEKVDKHMNTFETDPEFLKFKELLNKSDMKISSNDLLQPIKSQGQESSLNDPLQVPLLLFLKERSNRKLLDKKSSRGGRLTSKPSSKVVSKKVLQKGQIKKDEEVAVSSQENTVKEDTVHTGKSIKINTKHRDDNKDKSQHPIENTSMSNESDAKGGIRILKKSSLDHEADKKNATTNSKNEKKSQMTAVRPVQSVGAMQATKSATPSDASDHLKNSVESAKEKNVEVSKMEEKSHYGKGHPNRSTRRSGRGMGGRDDDYNRNTASHNPPSQSVGASKDEREQKSHQIVYRMQKNSSICQWINYWTTCRKDLNEGKRKSKCHECKPNG